MSVIKEIYDVAKDTKQFLTKITVIRRVLKTELKLNRKFLGDIEKVKSIDDSRRKQIIKMLDISELSAAVKFEIPYKIICNKKVSDDLAKKLKIKRIQGYNFEKLIESLYLKVSYIKKDIDNDSLDLNSRLNFIYKYNNALLRLLS